MSKDADKIMILKLNIKMINIPKDDKKKENEKPAKEDEKKDKNGK